MNSLPCPGPDQFAGWLRADVCTAQADELFEHAAQCSECGAVLRDVEEDIARLSPAVRLVGQQDSYLDEPECGQAVCLAEQVGFELPASQPSVAQPAAPAALREYRLLEKLGEGGMGQVFKAFHSRLERVVALKVLAPARLNSPQAVNRFHREVRANGRLDHPCIVRATDAGEVEGTHFLVMDFVEGLNLAQLVRRLGPLPLADACELIRQAANGLQHAHAQGLVHRDIKPSNLMLSSAGQLKILDLGLARWQQESNPELTATDQIMGTAEYMAPEQFDNAHAVDTRADIYSLGCVLYHQLAGRPPFPRTAYDSTYRLMMAHTHQPLPALTEVRPEVPEAVLALLERMLAKAACDRYQTPDEVSQALLPLAQGADLLAIIQRAAGRAEPTAPGPAAADLSTPDWPCAGDTQIDELVAAKQRSAPSDPSPRRRGRLMWAGGIVAAAALGLAVASPWMRPQDQNAGQQAASDSPAASAQQQRSDPVAQSTPAEAAATVESDAPRGDAERLVALWVLAKGGELTIYPRGNIKQAESLPAASFQIQWVRLFSNVTDDDVARFRQLANLQGVELLNNPITDAALAQLVEIPSLRWLYLGRTKITDERLPELSRLTHLESLGLEDTKVSDEGFLRISGLPKLRELQLGNTAIHDASLAHLSHFPTLVRLNLYRTGISNAGIQHLAALPNLTYLNLQDNRLDDEAVADLSRLVQLKELNIKQTRITAAGAAALRQALKDCRIDY